MITSLDPLVEFEPPKERKIDVLTPYCAALTAGDALAYTELFYGVRHALAEQASPPIENIVDKIKEEYLRVSVKRQMNIYFEIHQTNSLQLHQ